MGLVVIRTPTDLLKVLIFVPLYFLIITPGYCKAEGFMFYDSGVYVGNGLASYGRMPTLPPPTTCLPRSSWVCCTGFLHP